MKELIDVFRMTEIDSVKRANIIIQLGQSINNRYGMNLTEGLVYELVLLLDPSHTILQNEFYKKQWLKLSTP